MNISSYYTYPIQQFDEYDGPGPSTVEEIFLDYSGRHGGILRALTTDIEAVHLLCDPEKNNLCLYGHPDETWRVDYPSEKIPVDLPEPTMGINCARDHMTRSNWLALISSQSDCWLLSVAFYLASHLNRDERKSLFNLINGMHPIYQLVTGMKPIQVKIIPIIIKIRGVNIFVFRKRCYGYFKPQYKPSGQADLEKKLSYIDVCSCGKCGVRYKGGEFWIGCHICQTWLHGKCADVNPKIAECFDNYKCSSCKPRYHTLPPIEDLVVYTRGKDA